MNPNLVGHFPSDQQQLIDSLNTPDKIQQFIDSEITYDPDREDRSVQQVLADKMGECYNGALLATVCLLNQGIESSIIELLARQDEEHILCVYKQNNKFGAIAQSKMLGLKSRHPIYTSIRDLVISYMEFYFDFDGRLTLSSHTDWFDLSPYNLRWLSDSQTVVQIGKDLRQAPHQPLVGESEPFFYVSPKRFWREILYIPKGTHIPHEYLKHRPKS